MISDLAIHYQGQPEDYPLRTLDWKQIIVHGLDIHQHSASTVNGFV